MELDELQIRDRRTSPERHRDAVARGNVRVGRLAVDLSRAAGREQHQGRTRRRQAAIFSEEPGPRAPAVLDEQIDDARM